MQADRDAAARIEAEAEAARSLEEAAQRAKGEAEHLLRVEEHERLLKGRQAAVGTEEEIREALRRVERGSLFSRICGRLGDSWAAIGEFLEMRFGFLNFLWLLVTVAGFLGPPVGLAVALTFWRTPEDPWREGSEFDWAWFWAAAGVIFLVYTVLLWGVSRLRACRKRTRVEYFQSLLVCGDPDCEMCKERP